MVSLETIEREIGELETRETTYAVCERLAWLYVCRDHLVGSRVEAPAAVRARGGSEFMREADGREVGAVLAVLDEYMETQRALYPKVYEGVMRRIRELPRIA